MNDQSSSSMPVWHGTTIMSVRKNGKVIVAGDGQVSADGEVAAGCEGSVDDEGVVGAQHVRCVAEQVDVGADRHLRGGGELEGGAERAAAVGDLHP